jgi:hypothetical protein
MSGEPGMELRIEISISDYRQGGGLRLSEQVMIRDTDFMAMSLILAKFHDVLTAIKEAKEVSHDGV